MFGTAEMERIEDCPQVQNASEYYAPADGKYRLTATSKVTGERQTFIVGDFDSVDAACVRAGELFDPKYRMTVCEKSIALVHDAGSPAERESMRKYRAVRTTSVTRLCGQQGRKSFDRRGEY